MPVLLQAEAIEMIDLIENVSERLRATKNDGSPVVDRNLVTIQSASETLDELKALNDLLRDDSSESCAA